MRKLLLFVSLIYCSLFASEEQRALRRIGLSYMEQETILTKKQIESFLETFPESPYAKATAILLGDVYFQEKNFEKALAIYNCIDDSSYANHISLMVWHCNYFLNHYEDLQKQLTKVNPDLLSETQKNFFVFYQAECLFNQLFQQDTNNISLSRQIEELYLQLNNTPLEAHAKIRLSYLYNQQGQAEKAQEIVETSFCKEDFLKATLSRQLEALNWAKLLFDMQEYEQVVQTLEPIKSKESIQLQALAYFQLQQYPQAYGLFKELNFDETNLNQDNQLLRAWIQTNFEIQNYEKISAIYKNLNKLASTNPVTATASLFYAKALRAQGFSEQALNILDHLIKNFPYSEESRLAHLEKGVCFMQQQEWQKSHNTLTFFAKNYPDHPLASNAVKLALSTTHQQLLTTPLQTPDLLDQFQEDITRALKTPLTLHPSEKNDYIYNLAKIHFDSDHPEKAIELLEKELNSFQDSKRQCEVSLFLAYAYKKQNQLSSFLSYIDQAQKIAPIPSDILLDAFSTSYQLYQQTEISSYLDQAALYLFQAYQQQATISDKNLIWLANYFLETKDPYNEIQAEMILQQILIPINQEKLEAYTEFYAYLLKKLTKRKAVALFENIKAIVSLDKLAIHPHFSSLLYSAAGKYLEMDQIENAKELYSLLIDENHSTDPKVFKWSQLQLAKLLYQQYFDSQNQDFLNPSLTLLRELQTNPSLEYEPLHIEAALTEMDVLAIQANNPISFQLDRLTKIKQQFTATDTVQGKHYQDMQIEYPENSEYLKWYLLYVEGVMLHLQSEEAYKEHNEYLSAKKHLLSEKIFHQLSSIDRKKYPDLVFRVESFLAKL